MTSNTAMVDSNNNSLGERARPLSVFVLLPFELNVILWEERYGRGEVPDKTPYGYHHAEEGDCSVAYSLPYPNESALSGLIRRGLQRVLGFNLVHAWRHRHQIFSSQVVWTHTEREHLAVAFLYLLFKRNGPPLIAQSVWLFDNWNGYSRLRKWFYKLLLHRAAVLTVHSPYNYDIAQHLRVPVELRVVKFGISLDSFPLKVREIENMHTPLRVLALGNDRDRDWLTFFEAIAARPGFEVQIASPNFPRHLHAPNLNAIHASHPEIKSLYQWADVVVVPLKSNHHVSGMSVILEATACGVPVIASDTGGLRAYFDEDEIQYVPVGNTAALRAALVELSKNISRANAMVRRAQARILRDGYTSRDFALRHCALSAYLVRTRNASSNIELEQLPIPNVSR